MAFPPINIYSQNCDPEGTLAKLLELVPEAKVTRHPDGAWYKLEGGWKRGWFKGKLSVKATHTPDYYSGQEWSRQRAGMAGYFFQFPGAENRKDLLSYIHGLAFSFNLQLDPDPVDDDPRLALAFVIAQHVDGVIFLPGRMLDGHGRVILDDEGKDDPEAVVPAHTSFDDRVARILAEINPSATDEAAEDLPPQDPPTDERLVRRLMVISALVERGFLEDPSVKDAEEIRQRNLKRLQESGAIDEAEPDERAGLECPVGELPEKSCWAFAWLSEGGMVIAWALGLAEMPAYDEQVDVQDLYRIAASIADGSMRPARRPTAEIEQFAFQMLAIHWRVRQYSLDQKAINFVEFAPRAWCGAMDLTLARIIDKDLALGELPIGRSSKKDWTIAGGIMQERRQAIHWVLGQHPVYSQNDTAT